MRQYRYYELFIYLQSCLITSKKELEEAHPLSIYYRGHYQNEISRYEGLLVKMEEHRSNTLPLILDQNRYSFYADKVYLLQEL